MAKTINITYRPYTANHFTYEGWSLITSTTSKQYKLRHDVGERYDAEGFAIINGRYVVALTSTFGSVGDYVDFTLASGKTLKCIIGDIKSQNDPNWSKYGHASGDSLNVIEFIVKYDQWYTSPMHANPGTRTCHPEWAGLIKQAVNQGNFWGGGGTPSGDYQSPSGTICIILGTQYILGIATPCFWIGSVHGDSLIYFNDFRFFKCNQNGDLIFIKDNEKQIWTRTNNIQDLSIIPFDLGWIFNGVDGLINGNGIVAPGGAEGAVEKAVQWAIKIANNNKYGYDWGGPLSVPVNLATYKRGFDCGGLVCAAFAAAGFNITRKNTAGIKNEFKKHGFKWISREQLGGMSSSRKLLRGDILLYDNGQPDPYHQGHAAIYIGNNQTVEAISVSIGIVVRKYHYGEWSSGNDRWQGVLRYGG